MDPSSNTEEAGDAPPSNPPKPTGDDAAATEPMEEDPPAKESESAIPSNADASSAEQASEATTDTVAQSQVTESNVASSDSTDKAKEDPTEVSKPEGADDSTPATGISTGQTSTQQAKKPRVDLSALPTRQYLDQTVVPVLLQGLSWLAKTRPEDPITELSKYLLEHKKEHEIGDVNGTV